MDIWITYEICITDSNIYMFTDDKIPQKHSYYWRIWTKPHPAKLSVSSRDNESVGWYNRLPRALSTGH
ncbi:hypothetical protein NQ317_008746, partial [Molorchus minor]